MITKANRLAKKYVDMCRSFSEEENLSQLEYQKLCGLVGVFVTSLIENDGPIEYKHGGLFEKLNNSYNSDGSIKEEIVKKAKESLKNIEEKRK